MEQSKDAVKNLAAALRTSLNIYQRINEVRKTNAYIKKEKTVDGKYKVVTHDQITAELRGDLIAQGIVIEPYLVEHRVVQDTLMFMGQHKNPIIRLEGVVDVFFVNIDEPKDRACVRVPAHALDAGDKGPGKLVSYAVKMAALKLFSIETGEDDEERVEKHASGTGLTVAAYDEWSKKIAALKGETVEKVEEAAQLLWELIHEAVNNIAKDPTSATKLRAQLTSKVSALKKAVKR